MSASAEKAAHVWERDPLDFYVEPRRATEGLLSVETFTGGILDPACGAGNIVETCIAAGLKAAGTDIKRRTGKPWFIEERDYLAPGYPWRADNIICNPPFYRAKGTEEFIRLALSRATRKVAVFTDLKFLAGSGRANGLYAEHPPTRVWIITPRPSCPSGAMLEAGGEASGGTADWVWLVWCLDERPPVAPALGWIRAADEVDA